MVTTEHMYTVLTDKPKAIHISTQTLNTHHTG